MQNIPNEILHVVALILPDQYILNFASTCKKIYAAIFRTEFFWKCLYQARFGPDDTGEPYSWKQKYRHTGTVFMSAEYDSGSIGQIQSVAETTPDRIYGRYRQIAANKYNIFLLDCFDNLYRVPWESSSESLIVGYRRLVMNNVRGIRRITENDIVIFKHDHSVHIITRTNGKINIVDLGVKALDIEIDTKYYTGKYLCPNGKINCFRTSYDFSLIYSIEQEDGQYIMLKGRYAITVDRQLIDRQTGQIVYANTPVKDFLVCKNMAMILDENFDLWRVIFGDGIHLVYHNINSIIDMNTYIRDGNIVGDYKHTLIQLYEKQQVKFIDIYFPSPKYALIYGLTDCRHDNSLSE